MWKVWFWLLYLLCVAQACVRTHTKSYAVGCNTETCDNCGFCSITTMYCQPSEDVLAKRFADLPGEAVPIPIREPNESLRFEYYGALPETNEDEDEDY